MKSRLVGLILGSSLAVSLFAACGVDDASPVQETGGSANAGTAGSGSPGGSSQGGDSSGGEGGDSSGESSEESDELF